MLYSTNNDIVAKHCQCLPISPGHYYIQVCTPAPSSWLFPNKTFKNWGTNNPHPHSTPLPQPWGSYWPMIGQELVSKYFSHQGGNSGMCVLQLCQSFPAFIRSSHIWFIGSHSFTVPWSHCLLRVHWSPSFRVHFWKNRMKLRQKQSNIHQTFEIWKNIFSNPSIDK